MQNLFIAAPDVVSDHQPRQLNAINQDDARNYAINQARKRRGFRGGFYDITESETDTVPNWITFLNVIFSLGALGLLIGALIIRF